MSSCKQSVKKQILSNISKHPQSHHWTSSAAQSLYCVDIINQPIDESSPLRRWVVSRTSPIPTNPIPSPPLPNRSPSHTFGPDFWHIRLHFWDVALHGWHLTDEGETGPFGILDVLADIEGVGCHCYIWISIVTGVKSQFSRLIFK